MNYFTDKTGYPSYEEWRNNPDYILRTRQITCKVEQMTPEHYLQECDKLGATSTGISPSLVQEYTARARSGEKMPLPILDYYRREQEGRHRARVAQELGLKKMPVLVIKKVSQHQWETFMKKKYPEIYQYMR